MSMATIELYCALVEAGVDEDKARQAAEAIVSREEPREFDTNDRVTASWPK